MSMKQLKRVDRPNKPDDVMFEYEYKKVIIQVKADMFCTNGYQNERLMSVIEYIDRMIEIYGYDGWSDQS